MFALTWSYLDDFSDIVTYTVMITIFFFLAGGGGGELGILGGKLLLLKYPR